MRVIALRTLVFSALAVTAAAQPSTATAPALNAVLRSVPDDAHLMLVIPSLDGLVEGVAAFARATGAGDPAELTAASLLKPWLGSAVAGLDTGGPVIVVLSAEHDEPLLLARVRCCEKWTRATQPAPRAGVALYDFGPDGCMAATVGEVAVFAREHGELRRAIDAAGRCVERLGDEWRAVWSQRQALLWIDVQAWRPRIDSQMAIVARGMYMGMAAAGPDAEIGTQVWSWMFDQFKRTLGEAEIAGVGLRIGAAGVHVDGRVTFRPGTTAARYLDQVRRPGRDLLRGLPAGPAPLVMAYEWEDTAPGSGLNESLARAIAGMDALKQKVGHEKLQTVLRMSAEMNLKVPGSNAVFSTCPDGPGLLYWGLYLTSEGAAVQREMRRICELTPELVSAWGTFPAAMKHAPSDRVAGTEVDVYEFDFGSDAAAIQPIMHVIYGQNSTLYMAPHREGVAYTFGPREHARRKLAELLAPDAAPLSGEARVAEVLRVLAPDPQGCLLVDLPAVLGAVTTLAAQFGLPAPPFEAPATTSTLAGLTWYLEPRAVRAELYVPAAPIKAVVRYAERIGATSGDGY